MICKKFGFTDELYLKYEADAMKSFDENFVCAERVRSLAVEAGLSDEHINNAVDFMNWASADIKKFMWLFYFIQFETDEDFSDYLWQIDEWSIPVIAEKKSPGMLKACVYLLSAEHLRSWLRERNLSNEFLKSYFDRYRYLVKLNMITHNTNGLCRLSPFLYAYSKPFSIVVGRLAYQIAPYYKYCEVYESEKGKRVFVALPNYSYDETGHIADCGNVPCYEPGNDKLVCQLFNEDGTLSKEISEINYDEYTKILSPGDKVATIHIPEGGKLSEDVVWDSLRKAWKLINNHMTPIKAFVCKTWFIDPGLRSVFKPGANMLKFADFFDIICTEDNKNHSIFEHIFVTKPTELKNLVPKNEFQKTMLDRALRGEKIYWSYGLMKKENMKKINSQG